MAKQQRISSLLTQRRLRFLGHLSRMSEDRLPKQLLVSAPVGGKRTAGGQKRGWSDLVSNDLKQCNFSRSWREQAQERDSWRATIRPRVEVRNKQVKDKEKGCKDEQKRRRQQHLVVSDSALHCKHLGCSSNSESGRFDQPSTTASLHHTNDPVSVRPPDIPSAGASQPPVFLSI